MKFDGKIMRRACKHKLKALRFRNKFRQHLQDIELLQKQERSNVAEAKIDDVSDSREASEKKSLAKAWRLKHSFDLMPSPASHMRNMQQKRSRKCARR